MAKFGKIVEININHTQPIKIYKTWNFTWIIKICIEKLECLSNIFNFISIYC